MHYSATPEDHKAGTLASAILDEIHQAIMTTGYAVVSNLVSEETQELLLPSILEDADLVRAAGELTPHEKHTGVGHLQLGLRRYAPFVRADMVANPLIECVVAKVIGSGAWLGFYNGNVNCPGSTFQPLHFDRPYSWRTPEAAEAAGQTWPPPTTTLSCSLALADITQANGPTEIYPGSQHETAVAQWTTNRLKDHPELLEKWGPPSSMEIPAGAVCFRDPRMWHRGVPNHSDKPRAMMALTYHSALGKSWRGTLPQDANPDYLEQIKANPSLKLLDDGEIGDGRLVFHESARTAFEKESLHGISRNVRFVEDEVNHLVDAHLRGGARVGALG